MKTTDHLGFTLTEVLVSVFILTIGVIGTVGLQLATLRTAQYTAYQTTAVQLASEIADALRSHRNSADEAGNANPYIVLDYSSRDAPPTGAASCHASTCMPEELAYARIAEWKNRVRRSLPGGRIRICRDAEPWQSGTGAFKWGCTAPADPVNAPLAIKIGWIAKAMNSKADKSPPTGLEQPPNMTMLVVFDAR